MKNTGNLYKQLLSGLFLALYMFITLPVQYWHHHPVSTYTIEKGNTHSLVTEFNDTVYLGIDCTICSHQYAAYCLDIDQTILTLSTSQTLLNAEYAQQLVSQIKDGLSNKGPPAII